jgi:hypothetical protein
VPKTWQGEKSRQPGEDRSVRGLQHWSVGLPSEDRHLMAQKDDLDRQVRVTATNESDQLEDTVSGPP